MPQYTMSQQELESYLARSITLENLADFKQTATQNIYTDVLRMVDNIRPKFIGKAALLSGDPADDANHFVRALQTVTDIHLIDSSIIVQAAIPNFVHQNLSAVGTPIPIPSWAYTAFGYPTPSAPEHFEFTKIVYDHWATSGNRNPDLNRPQAKMWFYYRARKYIDAGFQAIHLGGFSEMTTNDYLNQETWDLLSKIRQYAASKPGPNFVLLDAHTRGAYYNNTNQLLFDFHSNPIKLLETSETQGNKGCNLNTIDSLYGNTLNNIALGGQTFMGWQADVLPYLLELDDYGISNSPGQLTGYGHPDQLYNWGYDEITWFALQSSKFRKYWLQYAYSQLNYFPYVAHFQMPGIRKLTIDSTGSSPTYFSNTPSAALPNPDTNNDGFPNLNTSSSNNGYDLEETIKDIWNEDTILLKATPLVQGNVGSYQIIETAATPSGNNIFCLGSDNKLYCYWKKSGQPWQHSQLLQNVSNVGGSLIVDKYGRIYYRGTDKRIHTFYYKQGWKNEQLVNNAPANVEGKIHLSNSGHNIFYRGTDGKMYNYWKSGGSWKVGVLSNQVNNVAGNITVHSNGKIFYKGTDKRIHYFKYNNGWQNVTLNSNAPSNVNRNFVVANHGKNVFYRDFGGAIQNYWQSGNTWEHSFIPETTSGIVNFYGDIQIDKFNKLYSRRSNNQIHLNYYDQGWLDHSLDPNFHGLDSELHITDNADFIFFRNADQALDHLWFDGDNWTSQIKWEMTLKIKDVPFIEKGDQLYVVSVDNKIYALTFGAKY